MTPQSNQVPAGKRGAQPAGTMPAMLFAKQPRTIAANDNAKQRWQKLLLAAAASAFAVAGFSLLH